MPQGETMDARVKEIEARCEGFWTDTLTGKVYWVLHLEFTPDDYKKSIAKKRAELKANYAALRESAEREEKLVDAENKRLSENPVQFMVQGGPVVMSKDFDAMKARAETAEARLTAALEVLKAVEWPNHDGIARYCHKCQRYEHCGHAPDCTLDAVLNKGEKV